MSTCMISGVATRVCARWRPQTDVAWKFLHKNIDSGLVDWMHLIFHFGTAPLNCME